MNNLRSTKISVGMFYQIQSDIYIYIYIYTYTRFQKHCSLKNIYTYIYTFCFHIYSFVFAL